VGFLSLGTGFVFGQTLTATERKAQQEALKAARTELEQKFLALANGDKDKEKILVEFMKRAEWPTFKSEIIQKFIDAEDVNFVGSKRIDTKELEMSYINSRICIRPKKAGKNVVFNHATSRPDSLSKIGVEFALSKSLAEKLSYEDQLWAEDLGTALEYNFVAVLAFPSKVSEADLKQAGGKVFDQSVYVPPVDKPFDNETLEDFVARQSEFRSYLKNCNITNELRIMFLKTGLMCRVSDLEGAALGKPRSTCNPADLLLTINILGLQVPVLVFNNGQDPLPKAAHGLLNTINGHLEQQQNISEKRLLAFVQNFGKDKELSPIRQQIVAEYSKTLANILKNRKQMVATLEKKQEATKVAEKGNL